MSTNTHKALDNTTLKVRLCLESRGYEWRRALLLCRNYVSIAQHWKSELRGDEFQALQCWIWSFVIVKCFDRWTWTAPRKRWLDDINTATKTRVVTHSVFCILGAQNALLYVIILSRKVHLGRMSSGLLFLFNTTGEKIVEYQIYYVSIWTTFCRMIAPISNLE